MMASKHATEAYRAKQEAMTGDSATTMAKALGTFSGILENQIELGFSDKIIANTTKKCLLDLRA